MKLEFKECSVCANKPGSPILCNSCYDNREVISILKLQIKFNFKVAKIAYDLLPLEEVDFYRKLINAGYLTDKEIKKL